MRRQEKAPALAGVCGGHTVTAGRVDVAIVAEHFSGLTGGSIGFDGTISGAKNLTISAGGDATFGGVVGALSSLDVLAGGLIIMGAASVRLAGLLDRPARRQVPVKIDFTGFVIPDRFVIGYGLDYSGLYRELPHIYALT